MPLRDDARMRMLQPVVRFVGWLVVVIAAVVGVLALIVAGSAQPGPETGGLVIAIAAFLASGAAFWVLQRTAGETDDPAVRYQPSSVVEEMAVPVLRTINEYSRPFVRGGVGIVTIVAWLAAILALLFVWTGVAVVIGVLFGVVTRAFEGAGMVTPDPVSWVAGFLELILPIAAVVWVYRWGWRNPAIRYWLRP